MLLPTICFLLPSFGLAQQNKVIVQPADQVTVKAGGSATEVLKVGVLPGFHVNSDKPKDEFLIPLKLTWSGPLTAESTTYPTPEEIKVGNANATVFTGNFDVQTKFVAPPNAPRGATTMNGKLRYQACNNEMCFRPMSVDVRVPVLIH